MSKVENIDNKNSDLPKFISEAEQKKMLEKNPYTSHLPFGLPNVEYNKYNHTYMMGFLSGRSFTLNKMLDYIRENKLDKKNYAELFKLLNQPIFEGEE